MAAEVVCMHALPSQAMMPMIPVAVPDSDEARDPRHWRRQFPGVDFSLWLHPDGDAAEGLGHRIALGLFRRGDPVGAPVVGYTAPRSIVVLMPDGSHRRAARVGPHRSGLDRYGLVLGPADIRAPEAWRELLRRRHVA